MTKPLTEREKLVLHAIVRAPSSTDRELAEATGLKHTTFMAIRRRLGQRGYYSIVRIPDMRSLGAEIFSATYCNYKATVPLNIRLITGRRLAEMHSEVFWAGSEYSQAVFFQFARNFTDAKKNIVEMEKLYMAQGFLGDGGINFLAFPFGLSELPLFFDYEPLLRQTFGIPGGGAGTGGYRGAADPVKLTRTGKKAYHGLIENPGLNDREIASRTGISHRTVTKMRGDFESAGLFRTVAVPDLQKIGFKMLAFDHAKLNLRIPEQERKEMLNALMEIRPPILLGMAGDDAVALTAYEDFEVYRRSVNSFSEVYKQDDIFTGEPRRLLFSLPEMEMLKDHVYGPGVASLLGLSVGEP